MNKHDEVSKISEKALAVPGVFRADVYAYLGRSYERQEKFDQAREAFKNAILYYISKSDIDKCEEYLMSLEKKCRYCSKDCGVQ